MNLPSPSKRLHPPRHLISLRSIVAATLWLTAILSSPALAQSCSPVGACPLNAKCEPAIVGAWEYGCSYPNGWLPGGDDAACRSASSYPFASEEEMESLHEEDLQETFCKNTFNLTSDWTLRDTASCLYGVETAQTRVPGDQCPDNNATTSYCFEVQQRSDNMCGPWEPWFLNNWERSRPVVCPPGTDPQGNTCVVRGFNPRGIDQCQVLMGKPVNALSGNKRLVETDWVDRSASGLLTFKRTYASYSAPDVISKYWPVGRAWRHNFDLRLVDSSDGVRRTVTAYRADGHLTYFQNPVNNVAFEPAERMLLTLVAPPAGGVSYRIRNADDSVEAYDADGLLLSIEHGRSGHSVTVHRDIARRITILRDNLGREITFAYASASTRQISTLTMPDSSTIAFGYTGEALSTVTYGDLTTRSYEYYAPQTGNPTLLKRVLHNGSEYSYYEYGVPVFYSDGVMRYLATRSRLSGASADHTFNYTLNPWSASTTTVVTTPLGATDTLKSVVRDGRLLLAERSENCTSCGSGGTTRRSTYDEAGLVLSTTDFRGTITEHQYDDRGRETLRREAGNAATDANGCPIGTTFNPSNSPCGTGGSCRSSSPFPGAHHGELVGIGNQFYVCKGTPSSPASPALRTTATLWHATFNQPTERSVTNASNATESLTRWAYNARGQVSARCEIDAADANAVAYTCSDTTAPPPTARVRRWVHSYCEAADVAAANSTCPILGLPKSINGPRNASDTGMSGLEDATSYTYYAATDESGCGTIAGPCHRKGDLWKTTNALGHVTEILSYDQSGRERLVRDPNGTLRGMTYNVRGWLTGNRIYTNATPTTSAGDAVTSLAYDAVGNIMSVTQPDGVMLQYVYDTAHRLTDVIDSLGNRIHYTLDPAGNRIKEETFDASYNPGVPGQGLKRSLARQYNALSRLVRELNASNAATRDSTAYDSGGLADGFDPNGNAVQFKDGLDIQTRHGYDALDRLVSTIQDYTGTDPETANATTEFTYDARSNLRTVKDPDNLTTTYTYDGLNDLTDLDSPDTGHTDYAYDLAGNRTGQTDNRGITSTYTYDALNRLRAVTYPTASLNVAFHYDESNATTGCASSHPVGRLTRMTDSSGTTTYCYDRRGNVIAKSQVTTGNSLAITYTYTLADRIATITYPSGGIATYTYDAVGRTSSLTWKVNAGATPTTIVSGINYYPFGPAKLLKFGNGRELARNYDSDYVIDAIASTAIDGLTLDFTRDVMGNLTGASSTLGASPPQRQYVYDNLYRLSGVNDATGTMLEDYDYNKTGDRTLKQFAGQAAQVYTYLSGTHRLGSVAGVNRSYDANGNTTDRGDGVTLGYDHRNRLASAAVPGNATTYDYSGRGERTLKVQANGGSTITNRYVYNESGQMLADLEIAVGGIKGGFLTEYLFIDAVPVAVSRPNGLSYIEADHLGTPRVAANPTTNAKEWGWDLLGKAFGENAAATVVSGKDVSLRYPGQWTDTETKLNHNYYRDFEAEAGRYAESDPIGLRGGSNTYSYVESNPLGNIDPYGLVKWTGSVYAWGFGHTFLAGGLFTFTLGSECVNGKKYLVRVFAKGIGSGVGVPATNTGSSVEFDDHLSALNPYVFNGRFVAIGAGAGFPVGYSVSRYILGGADSGGFSGGAQLGYDLAGFSMVGNSNVTWAIPLECCD